MIDINMKMTIWPIQERYFFDVQSFYLSNCIFGRERVPSKLGNGKNNSGGEGLSSFAQFQYCHLLVLGSEDFGKRNGCGNGLSM